MPLSGDGDSGRVALEADMSPDDRPYFMLRHKQELDAAAHSSGPVRGRHEELAWLYEMRINYLDRGITGEEFEASGQEERAPVQHVIVAA
jgi:hypothetical protein